MRNIVVRLIGLAGLIGIAFTWYLWGQFLFSLMVIPSLYDVRVGIFVAFLWFVGEIALSLLAGAISVAMLFT